MNFINTQRLFPSCFFNTKLMTLLSVVSLLFLTNACKNNNVNSLKIESKKELVLELHDELMLDLPEIKRINKVIEQHLGDSSQNNADGERVKMALSNLNKADKAMWDWMHHFDVAYQHENDSLTLLYFDDQYYKLQLVQTGIDSAIQGGKNIIINYERVQ